MNMRDAIAILGINRARYELQNMTKALSLFSVFNTKEETARLNAGQYVLTHWRDYQDACNQVRNFRLSHKIRAVRHV